MWRQVLGNVGSSGRMGRILVVGPHSDEGLDAVEAAEGLVVEHLVFDSIQSGAVGVAHPARRVWIGRNSLGALRFELAAFFGRFTQQSPERSILAVLASCAEILWFRDVLARDPRDGGGGFSSGAPGADWSARRKLFLSRLLNEFGFLEIRHFEHGVSEPHPGDEGGSCYLVQRGSYRPMLVHVHVPKTAGISIRKVLETTFPNRVLPVDHRVHRGNHGNLTTIHSLLLAHSQFDALCSHLFRFSYPSVVAGRLMLYFTFLRNPADQFKSYVRFLKYSRSQFGPEDNLPFLGEIGGMTLVEIARALMDGRKHGDLDVRWFMPCRFFGLTDQSEPVIRRLMGFVSVGIFERMEESLRLLKAKLAPYEIDLAVESVPKLNASRGAGFGGDSRPPDYQQQEMELDAFSELHDFLVRHHASDFEVYRWALSSFEAQLRALAPAAVRVQ